MHSHNPKTYKEKRCPRWTLFATDANIRAQAFPDGTSRQTLSFVLAGRLEEFNWVSRWIVQ